jgi:hypothetical protein
VKVTSAECKITIVKEDYPLTKLADWKRESKRNGDNGTTVRVFRNAVLGRSVAVIEKDGQIIGSQDESGFTPTQAGASLLEQLQANPITVDLRKADTSGIKGELEQSGRTPAEVVKNLSEILAGFSGRIVWGASEEDDAYEDEEHETGFCCGPETKRGYLEDTYDGGVDPKLEALFADFPSVMTGYPALSVQEAENAHSLGFPPELKVRDVKAIIKMRLERSGAVEMGI